MLEAITAGGLLDILENKKPEYEGQIILVVKKGKTILSVSAKIEKKIVRLITAWESRKLRKLYLKV